MSDPIEVHGLIDRALDLAAKHGWAGVVGGIVTAVLAFLGSRRARAALARKAEAEAAKAELDARSADARAAAEVRLVEANAAKIEAEAEDLEHARWARLFDVMEKRVGSLEARAEERDAEIERIQDVNRQCEERAGRLEHALRIVLRALRDLDIQIPALDAAIAGLEIRGGE